GGSGRMANARATVHVVRSQNDAGELLHKIVLLVRAASRTEHSETIRAGRLYDATEVAHHAVDGLRPRDFAPRGAVANHWHGDTIIGMGEFEGVTSLHTQVALADGRFENRFDLDDAVVACAHIHFAAHTAIGARRARPPRCRAMSKHGLVLQGSGRTRIRAGAATHAI